MREILFRGREKGGSKWFEGDMSYLVHDKRKCYIFPPDGYDSPDRYEVDPTTVGQYTGLTDRNGLKIFEGDIILHYNRFYDKTAFSIGVIFWSPGKCDFKKRNLETGETFRVASTCDYEVIGNIYDNPELMEDKQC